MFLSRCYSGDGGCGVKTTKTQLTASSAPSAPKKKNAKIKGVIFDMDGTLTVPGSIDFVKLRRSIRSIALGDRNVVEGGFNVDGDVLGLMDVMEGVNRFRCDEVLRGIEVESRENMELTDGVVDCLAWCRDNNVRCGVVTRNVHEALLRLRDIVNDEA